MKLLFSRIRTLCRYLIHGPQPVDMSAAWDGIERREKWNGIERRALATPSQIVFLDYGSISRVAKELGVGKSHVCLVAHGHRTSARVTAALAIERERVASQLRKQLNQHDRGAA